MLSNLLSSTLPTYAVVIIIAVIAVQYGFALFCLLKLAYLDISKKEYVLWNLFILLIFFIGGITFLIYWFKVKDTKRITPYTPNSAETEGNAVATEAEEKTEASGETEKHEETEEGDETPDEKSEEENK